MFRVRFGCIVKLYFKHSVIIWSELGSADLLLRLGCAGRVERDQVKRWLTDVDADDRYLCHDGPR